LPPPPVPEKKRDGFDLPVWGEEKRHRLRPQTECNPGDISTEVFEKIDPKPCINVFSMKGILHVQAGLEWPPSRQKGR